MPAPASPQPHRPVASAPDWLSTDSPWGCAWSELIEHRDWWEHFDAPPTPVATELRRAVLRRRPSEIPRVLSEVGRVGADWLGSPLARLLDGEAEGVRKTLQSVSRRAALRALDDAGTPLPERLTALLSPAADEHRLTLLRRASQLTRAVHGPSVALYAPLYLSNECTNRCSYCGFSYGNEVARKTLSLSEVERNAQVLLDQGIEELLLLTGEAPKQVGMEYLEQVVSRLQGRFRRIGLEVYPMSEPDYARLLRAGVDTLTIYQETYDPSLYRRVHLAGRKRNFLWRLGTPERAAAAGMSAIGLGALLGLSPWRFEAIALGLHAAALQALFPGLELSLSFPRLRPALGLSEVPHPVSEEELVHLMSALRIALPGVGFVLSTRESARFRDRVAPWLLTKMSAGSCTEPGGYARGDTEDVPLQTGAEQFAVADHRNASAVRASLAARALTPVG